MANLKKHAEIARAQVKNGAHVIDICLANPDRDELEDIAKLHERSRQKSKSTSCY